MSSSKLGVLCERMIEAGWLTVAVITPLFFNMYSRRGFEADKLLLLRAIAGAMAAAWLVGWIEQRRATRLPTTAARYNTLTLPALALVVAYLLTTAASIAPRISFFGSYTRLQGTYTTLSYVVVFFLILHRLHTRRQLDRLVLAIILSSLLVALYSLVQRCDLDPLSGPIDASVRAPGTMGNPIYTAAYLAMAFFLALGKLVECWQAIRGGAKPLAGHLVRAVGYVCIAIAQLAAIVISNSRGPFLGWLAGLALFAVLLAALWRRRGLMVGLIGAGLLGAVFLVLSSLPHPYIGRLTDWTINSGDTARVRILIWKGSASLAQPHEPLDLPDGAPDPLNLIRPLVGYGPESMYLVFGQAFPPELVSETGYAGNTLVGRSHNETWDSLVTGGVLGLGVYQLLFLGFFVCGLRAIGFMPTDRERNGLIGLWVGLGLVGGLVPVLLGQPEYLGLGLPAGTLIALGLYLVFAIRSNAPLRPTPVRCADQILVVALLAGVLSHYVEIQFSFEVAATRMLFWVFAGLVGVQSAERLTIQDTPVEPVAHQRSSAQSSGWIGSVAAWAALVAALLLTLLYAFITNAEQISDPVRIVWRALTFNAMRGRASSAILIMLVLAWAWALILILAEMSCAGILATRRDGPGVLALYSLFSLAPAVAFALGFASRLSALTGSAAVWLAEITLRADRYVGLFDYYVVYLFMLLLLTAVFLMAEDESLPSAWSSSFCWKTRKNGILRPFQTGIGLLFQQKLYNYWGLVALVPVAVAAGLWINTVNLNPVRADMIYRRALVYDMLKEWDFAIALDQHAIHLAPDQEVYYRGWGQALIEKASLTSSAGAPQFTEQTTIDEIRRLGAQQIAGLGRDDSFYAARAVFARGRTLNPLNADHTAGLALVYQRWASLAADPVQRSKLAEQSGEYYAQAIRLMPRDASLWNELAMVSLMR